MKKFFWMICFTLVCSIMGCDISVLHRTESALGMTVYASEVEEQEEQEEQQETSKQIYLEEAKISIELPASYYVLEQEIEEDDTSVASIGLDREKVQAYFEDYQIMLYALAQDNNHDIVVTMNHRDDLQYIYRLKQLDDEYVEELLQAAKKSYEDNSYKVNSAQTADIGGTKYIIFDMEQSYEEQTVKSRQYYTINDGDCYHITLHSYNGEISVDMEAMFTGIIESITYEEEMQGVQYENGAAGVEFSLVPGWEELEMEETQEYIQMQFVHSNGLGESIQFLCQDIWGRLGRMQQLTTTRVDIDERCMQEASEKWLPEYLGNFFSDYQKVYQVEYNGVTYYTSEEPMAVSTESSQGDYFVRSVVTVRDGILYAFRYGYFENGNLHETNFDTMLSTVAYETAELLSGDQQNYQDLIDMIRQAFVGGVLIILILTIIVLFYVLGNYETEREAEEE